ncbi:MAG: large subunit ribosomal protein [Pseudomonadota bacterium]|jgi:large subunit ribosomal protein L13|nr:large subunit ribosomal protein [Pseudomonadota bacterium]
MGTFSAKSHEVRRGWYVVDATDQTLGRLASAVAHRLRGKHKPEFTPHVDTGDYIVIINAANIRVTGNKLKDKLYRHHTGYVGNMKTIALGKMMQEHPERAITKAVKGMLPKNSLGAAMLKKLRVFPGAEHEHAAQQPEILKL